MRAKIKIWERALAAALLAAVAAGPAVAAGAELESKLIRLRVVANSDSEPDQAAKLAARDALLLELEPLLSGCEDRDEAEALIKKELPRLRELAASAAGMPAELALREAEFPSVSYDGFALPAGRYLGLTATLGSGEGRNWWCVVFPPLCLTAAESWDGLSDGAVAVISGEGSETRVRFKILEWWAELRRWLS